MIQEDVNFNRCVPYVHELRIGSKGHSAEPWWVDAISTDDGALVISKLQFDLAEDVWTAHSDWEQRVTSAVNGYDQMWEASPLYIDLRIEHIHQTGENIITTDCDDATTPVDQYQSWLDGPPARTSTGVDAYQWWTAHNMDQAGTEDCYGKSAYDKVKEGSNAATVIEGNDQPFYYLDDYDPDETTDRGLVSGHEFGHLYGQEGHIYTCNADCNLMADWGDTAFWFTAYTKLEIWSEFNYNEEWDGLN